MKTLHYCYRWLGLAGCGIALFICSRYVQEYIVPSQRWNLIDYLTYALIALAAAILAARLKDPLPVARLILRYFLAFVFLLYGFAKLIDSQFYPLLYRSDKVVHELNGMDIAWVFFGHSYAYKYFLGITQVVAALLFFSRRGALTGLLILLPVIINIVWVNFAFNIPVKFDSCFYLAVVLYLLSFYAPALLVFVRAHIEPFSLPRIATGILLILVVGSAFYEAKKDKGDTTQTALYGIYDIAAIHTNGRLKPHPKLKTFYFDIDGLMNVRTDSGKLA